MKHSLIIVTLIVINLITYAQWTPTDITYGGEISRIIALKDTLIAANIYYERIYATGLKEFHWNRKENVFPKEITCMFAKGDSLIASTKKGIFLSTNYGNTWSSAFNKYDFDSLYKTIVCEDIILLHKQNVGLYISRDNGASFDRLRNEGIELFGYGFNASANGDTIIVSENTGALISFDKGSTWKLSGLERAYPNNISLWDFCVHNNYIFASSNNYIYYTKNGGSEWDSIPSGGQVTKLFAFAGSVYALPNTGGVQKIKINVDSCFLEKTFLPDYQIKDITAKDNNLVIATIKGVFISKDSGATWQDINPGISHYGLNCFASKDSIIYASSFNGVFSSKDNGDIWIEENFSKSNYWSLSFKGNLCYAIELSYYMPLKVSEDAGKTFRKDTNMLSFRSVYDIHFWKDKVFAATNDGIFVTQDSGKVWNRVDASQANLAVFSIKSIGSNIIASCKNGILKSTDEGKKFKLIPFSDSSTVLRYLAQKDSVILCYNADYDKKNKLFISTDSAESWTELDNSFLDGEKRITSVQIYGNNIFLCEFQDSKKINNHKVIYYSGKIWLSSDLGKSWKDITGNIVESYPAKIFIHNDYIFASGWGAYKAKLSDFGITSAVEDDYKLEGSNYLYCFPPYPNPARNEVRSLIYWDTSLDIDKDDISVYNLFGKVAGREDIIIEKTAPYSGYLVWDCSRYEPGVYFIVVRHGDATQMIKAIVE
ncbi:MAG: T9SS type A sorting domain-containing protein [Chloroflexota bacterium]